MEKISLTVPEPCHEDWNKMKLKNNGKYCGACNKTVIDFTTWEKKDIIKYLQNKNKNVCGHFKSLQLAVKIPKHHEFLMSLYFKTENNVKTPLVKKFILSLITISLVVVGCNSPYGRTTGEISIDDTKKNNILKDSVFEKSNNTKANSIDSVGQKKEK